MKPTMQNIRTIRRALSISCLSLVFIGCSTVTPKDAFFRHSPNLKSKYVQFDEASPGVIEDFMWERYNSKLRFLDALCERFPQHSDVTNYASQVRERVEQFHQDDVKFRDQLKHDFDAKMDSIFYYDYREGDFQEQGWLILRRDQIFKKYPISTGKTREH